MLHKYIWVLDTRWVLIYSQIISVFVHENFRQAIERNEKYFS